MIEKDQDQRAAFEAWYRKEYGSTLYCESQWRGWQAAIAHERQQRGEPVAPPEPDVISSGEHEDSYSRGVVEAAMRNAHDRGYSVGWDHGNEHGLKQQPAEPVKGEPSGRDLLDLWQPYKDFPPGWIEGYARAVLARYGAQPADDRSDHCAIHGCAHKEAGCPVWETPPAVSAEPVGTQIMAAFAERFGLDAGWQDIPGSWFTEGYMACFRAAPVTTQPTYDGDTLTAAYMAGQDAGRRSVPEGWWQAVADLLKWAENEVCTHEETHRGGAIWEICDHCGRKWADDEGGKPAFVWPEEITRIRALLEAAPIPSAGVPAQKERTYKGDIVGWLRRRTPWDQLLIPGRLAGEIADHIEALQKDTAATRSPIATAPDGSAVFVNHGEQPDDPDLDCPYCGGSGHRDDATGGSAMAFFARASQLVADAKAASLVVRIDLVPRKPLAMGSLDMRVDVRPARVPS